jgi:hypothetical protein
VTLSATHSALWITTRCSLLYVGPALDLDLHARIDQPLTSTLMTPPDIEGLSVG